MRPAALLLLLAGAALPAGAQLPPDSAGALRGELRAVRAEVRRLRGELERTREAAEAGRREAADAHGRARAAGGLLQDLRAEVRLLEVLLALSAGLALLLVAGAARRAGADPEAEARRLALAEQLRSVAARLAALDAGEGGGGPERTAVAGPRVRPRDGRE